MKDKVVQFYDLNLKESPFILVTPSQCGILHEIKHRLYQSDKNVMETSSQFFCPMSHLNLTLLQWIKNTLD